MKRNGCITVEHAFSLCYTKFVKLDFHNHHGQYGCMCIIYSIFIVVFHENFSFNLWESGSFRVFIYKTSADILFCRRIVNEWKQRVS